MKTINKYLVTFFDEETEQEVVKTKDVLGLMKKLTFSDGWINAEELKKRITG